MTMDGYTCDECHWQYIWTMGDRVKAVKRHQLAHLLDQPASAQTPEKREVKVPANQLIEYIEQRLRNVELA
jgi:predicted DNA-binding protein (UPF0278 family)